MHRFMSARANGCSLMLVTALISSLFLLLLLSILLNINGASAKLSDRFPKIDYNKNMSSPEDKFCADIMAGCPYLRSRTAKPTPSQLSPVSVNITFYANNFNGIDNLLQMLSIQGNFYLKWQLPPCADWTKLHQESLYSTTDIKLCTFKRNEIWKPLLAHTNSIGNYDVFDQNGGDVVIKNDGIALWQVSGRFDSSCNLSFKKFPFDIQECYLEVGFLFPSFITFNERLVIASDFISDSDIWDLDRNYTRTVSDQLTEKVQFVFRLSRVPSAYINSLFVPLALLSLAQVATLAIPAEDTGRAAFSVTVFLSFSIMQGVFDDAIPATSENMFLNAYISAQMIIAIGITIYSLFACRFARKIEIFSKPIRNGGMILIDILDVAAFIVAFTAFLLVSLLFYVVTVYYYDVGGM